MLTRRLTAVALLVCSLACATRRIGVPHLPHPAAAGPDITFIVRESGRLPLEYLSGVEVAAIGKDGTSTTLGRTFNGRLTVKKQRIRELNTQVIVFCGPFIQCGALRIEGPEWATSSLYDFDDWNVDLPPFVLYD